jgi:hypothetical protein
MVFVWLVLFVVVGTTIITYLKRAAARARERAGLPPRARVKLPVYWWVLSFLLLGINAVCCVLTSHCWQFLVSRCNKHSGCCDTRASPHHATISPR